MFDRYRATLALTSLLLLGLSPAHHHRHAGSRHHAAVQQSALDLYSRRALRRARIILQLKLLELHEQQLDGVRRALQRHLPVSQLFKEPPPTPRP